MKGWLKITVAVLITAMICIPVTATVIGNDAKTLNVAGSTTVQPLMMELQKDFERYANVQMFVTGGGSGVGISSTLNGVADIGMLSRDLRPNEGQGILEDHIIAMDAVVIIVNSSVGIDDLSMDALVGIYSGTMTNWSEVGGTAIPMAVITREEGSGTRDCFDAAMKAHDSSYKIKETGINSVNSTGAVIHAVGSTPGAIGYINLDVAQKLQDERITEAKVDGIQALSLNILNGTYEISRDLVLVTKGEPDGMIRFFIDWILSTEGQNIVEKEGFVRIDCAVTGMIYDDNGNLLEGATVQYQVNGAATIYNTSPTGSDGEYIIRVLPGDAVIITGVTMEGYILTTPPAQVPRDLGEITSKIKDIDFEMEPDGGII